MMKVVSKYEEYKKKLQAKGRSSMYDLEILVLPLIKKNTRIIVQPPSRPPKDAQFISQFGGDPYFEKGEKWPCFGQKHLSFIFQIFSDGPHPLPGGVQLIQFFYDFDAFPCNTKDRGWLVKTYSEVNKENVIYIEKPESIARTKFCEIAYEQLESLPDWQDVHMYNPIVSKLSCLLDQHEPWRRYEAVVEKLIGEQRYQSQLCGYPKWIQGQSIPKTIADQNMDLLFQIDSEHNAGIMWGDVGLIYVFYNSKNFGQFDFVLQCH